MLPIKLRGFFYRRLSRLATCVMPLDAEHCIPLATKHDVASVADVMCHPFYWQLFGLMESAPVNVVDCGAHLGHFTMLADLCIRARFRAAANHYYLLEAHPSLISSINNNLRDYALGAKATVICGLLGREESVGAATLWAKDSNLLSSSSAHSNSAIAIETRHISLNELCEGKQIDILKIDIEGAEYELLERITPTLVQTKLLMIEFHDSLSYRHRQALARLIAMGLEPVGCSCELGSRSLAVFRRVK